MNFHSVLPSLILLSALIFFFLGQLCLMKPEEKKAKVTFAILCFITTWWLLTWAIIHYFNDHSLITTLSKFEYMPITFIPVFYYKFGLDFLKQENKFDFYFLRFSYIFSCLAIIVLWTTDIYIEGLYHYKWGYYPKANWFHSIYLFILSIQGLRTLFLLLKESKRNNLTPLRKKQVKYVFYALLIYFFAAIDYIPKYGINIYPLSFLFVLIASLIIFHSIHKYQLMNMSFIIRKSLIYSILIIILSCLYAILVFLLGFASISIGQSFWFSIISIITIVTISRPLQSYIKNIIDKLFFSYKYDFQKTLEKTSLQIKQISNKRELILLIEKIISNILRTEKTFYKDASEIKPIGLVNWIIKHKKVFIQDLTNKKELSKKEIAKVVIPLFVKNKLIGIINLSEKTSREPYYQDDIHFLSTISHQTSLALENIEINQKLIDSKRITIIGEIAAKLAHEIKNPIAAMKTMNQLIPKRKNDHDYLNKLHVTFDKQLERINNMLIELLKLGKPLELNITEFDLDNFLKKMLDFVKFQCKKKKINIRLISLSKNTNIKADKEQMSQLFLNLIQNAIQSISGKGEIIIKIEKKEINLETTTVISIQDTGTGIAKKDMKHIFEPFYTTKSNGTGLGLPIIKKIAEEHKFKIDIESTKNTGTTFHLFIHQTNP